MISDNGHNNHFNASSKISLVPPKENMASLLGNHMLGVEEFNLPVKRCTSETTMIPHTMDPQKSITHNIYQY
jgi:hypothetical protein